jgi:hypothetical protein
MEYTFNKPKVFLSHSKKDVDFIRRLDSDLRLCNIETWLDEVDIPHGKSWQDSIFEFGIPTCDAIIAYLTENSIESPVVKKEIDVALLQSLRDSNIAFLPYVNKNELRVKLRPDIQSLQTKEWNNQNYQTFLPSVIANIWQNYLRKTVSTAILNERYKITQLELELEKRKNQDVGIFSQNENTEFEYLSNVFNDNVRAEINIYIPNEENAYPSKPNSTRTIGINSLSLVIAASELNDFDKSDVFAIAQEACNNQLNSLYPNGREHPNHYELVGGYENVRDFGLAQKMVLFGLLETVSQKVHNGDYTSTYYTNIFTSKIHRFRFWLSFNSKLPEKVILDFVD